MQTLTLLFCTSLSYVLNFILYPKEYYLMHHFIINPHSKTGKARKLWAQLKNELNLRKVEYKEYFTERPGHATIIARAICNENSGIKSIIIVGGDGTANEVINGIESNEDILLGYIPTGSSNDLARGLGLPKDPLEALEHILNPKHFLIVDQGVIEYPDTNTSHKFAVGCGIGYDACVCREVLHSKAKNVLNKIGLGKLTYILIAAKQILTNKSTDAELIIDGAKHVKIKNMIFAASMIHKYEGGGLLMAPNAKSNDRKLSVCIASNISKLKIFLVMPTIFVGKHIHVKGVQVFDCSTLEIMTAKKTAVHTDGEVWEDQSHIRLSCTKQQVRMII